MNKDDSYIGDLNGIPIKVPARYVTGRVIYEGESAVNRVPAEVSMLRPISSIGFIIDWTTKSVFERGGFGSRNGQILSPSNNFSINAGIEPFSHDGAQHGELRKNSYVDDFIRAQKGSYDYQEDFHGLKHQLAKAGTVDTKTVFDNLYYSSEYNVVIGCTPQVQISARVYQSPMCIMTFPDTSSRALLTLYFGNQRIVNWLELRKIALRFLVLISGCEGEDNAH